MITILKDRGIIVTLASILPIGKFKGLAHEIKSLSPYYSGWFWL